MFVVKDLRYLIIGVVQAMRVNIVDHQMLCPMALHQVGDSTIDDQIAKSCIISIISCSVYVVLKGSPAFLYD